MGLVTPDYGLVFWMLLSFLIVLFILKKFAWKPVLQMIKEREKTISDSLNSAQAAKLEMIQLKEQNDKILAEARNERDLLLREAKETKDKIIKSSEHEAKERANKIIEDAQREIENQKNKALSEIKDKVAELSINIAEKILKRELASDSKQNEFLNSLINETKLN